MRFWRDRRTESSSPIWILGLSSGKNQPTLRGNRQSIRLSPASAASPVRVLAWRPVMNNDRTNRNAKVLVIEEVDAEGGAVFPILEPAGYRAWRVSKGADAEAMVAEIQP